jgi:hypothetical protein
MIFTIRIAPRTDGGPSPMGSWDAPHWQAALLAFLGAESGGARATLDGLTFDVGDDRITVLDAVAFRRLEVLFAADSGETAPATTREEPAPPAPSATALPEPIPVGLPSPPVAAPVPADLAPPPIATPDDLTDLLLAGGGTPGISLGNPRRSSLARVAALAMAPLDITLTPLFQREVRSATPTDANVPPGVTYREIGWAVPLGTDEEQAEELLRSKLTEFARSFEGHDSVFLKFSIFDEIFSGDPPLLPLATLHYQDWEGDPVLAFPRRDPLEALEPLSRAIPLDQAAFAPSPNADDEAFLRAALAVPHADGPPRSNSELFEAPARPSMIPADARARGSSSSPATADRGTSSEIPGFVRPEGSRVATVPPPGRPGTIPPGGRLGSLPPPPRMPGMTSSAPPRAGAVVDELVNDLRALPGMASLRTALAFGLTLAVRKLRATVGYVHLFDANRTAFVVALGEGAVEPGTVFATFGEHDPCLREVFADRKPHLVEIPGISLRRFAGAGPDATVLVAPMMVKSIRGIIELAGPAGSLDLEELRALDYIAGKLSDAIATHGIDRQLLAP